LIEISNLSDYLRTLPTKAHFPTDNRIADKLVWQLLLEFFYRFPMQGLAELPLLHVPLEQQRQFIPTFALDLQPNDNPFLELEALRSAAFCYLLLEYLKIGFVFCLWGLISSLCYHRVEFSKI
jgi:hypothetical protein